MNESHNPEVTGSEPGVFEYPMRIRYSEADHRGLMSLPALINAFQDCSTMQAEELGCGMAQLRERRCAWVLTHWHIVVERYPALEERVHVGTFASRFRGLTANRCFYLRAAEGLIARATSLWAFVDLERGRPAQPDPALIEAYGTHEALAMPPEERRVAVPTGGVAGEPVTVRRHHIDTNEHMNNAWYVSIALDLLPRELHPHEVRVDYKRSAVLGDVLYPTIAATDDRHVVVLDGAAGPSFAVIEFRDLLAQASPTRA